MSAKFCSPTYFRFALPATIPHTYRNSLHFPNTARNTPLYTSETTMTITANMGTVTAVIIRLFTQTSSASTNTLTPAYFKDSQKYP